MITDLSERIGTFGASDTNYIMGSFENKTFHSWWLKKMGLAEFEQLDNIYINTGNMLEIPVIRLFEETTGISLRLGKEPFKSKTYPRLMVNLDGYNDKLNVEIKCVKFFKAFDYINKIPNNYWRQVQVQMYVTGYVNTKLVVYGLIDEEYEFENQIDPNLDKSRLFIFDIEFDMDWIVTEYLPRLEYLINCLDKEILPSNVGYEKE